jgi:hypothetical protein
VGLLTNGFEAGVGAEFRHFVYGWPYGPRMKSEDAVGESCAFSCLQRYILVKSCAHGSYRHKMAETLVSSANLEEAAKTQGVQKWSTS